jgi:hypothetical protein
MIDNLDGRKWARFWLVVALLVSVIANVTHACLADSEITLWLRVPGALIWPLFTFAGIEILVRMIWERRLSHNITRWVLLSAAVPAAITSYQHQNSLLRMMGEIGFIQGIGPLAIDGLMIGCTMALLFTRKDAETLPPPPALIEPKTRDEIKLTDEQITAQLAAYEEREFSLASMLPQSISAPPSDEQPKHERAPRASNGQTEELVREMLTDAALPTNGNSTLRRYAKVARALRDNPQADIDARLEKVRPEIVANVIRPWAMSERVR